ncbi:hypothetical protein BC939DRAFT_505526 [Gamsiella multidivaricata]|uniref:uncharacterized protein n=1 Tax=Gamsiella multidivaricata TaxID=101098 RepID=UPI00221F531B|nr:uncharacterized protein BC939DRAFT_505526 [Gamsiella multidivaricata]KAI7819689.1 hypothetical protein BC939DRAFT_505526 [Gamsiella multidivaricata]
MHTARLLKESSKGMKPSVDVVPLITFVSGGLIGGTYMAFRKLTTDPHLRHHVRRNIEGV